MAEVLESLEIAGYRLSGSKSEFFKSEIEWIGHTINQEGIRPLQDKLTAIKELKAPENEKQLKSFWERFNIFQNTSKIYRLQPTY